MYRQGDVEEALAFAYEGARSNPRSGILLRQVAELEWLEDNLDIAADWADRAREPGVEWASLFEQHDAYVVLRAVYRAAERDEDLAAVERELARIDAAIAERYYGGAEDDQGGQEHEHEPGEVGG